ncbi:hypothetical protein GALMADRAFT_150470 [Galerina marginata CBS 339.88]|uniref:Uncharacterized protein n=1 Tax=Galerina marginata (strain CBS 339.88) TaxID=685588 RepID=A0A067TJD1_GALM3|nr:hypothetical protein GALMADRAFT_150470 [Galerina marginata CBS 339.88]
MLRVQKNDVVAHNWANPQIVQATAPSLIILTQLSRYFLTSSDGDSPASAFTISSYLSLVNRIFVLVSNLKESSLASPPKLAIFDSGLLKFKLPVTNQPSNVLFDDSDHRPQEIQILPVAEKLFEWVGIFEDDSLYVPSSQGEETTAEGEQRRQLRLYRVGREDNDNDNVHTISWTEVACPSTWSKLNETHFKSGSLN